MTRSNELLRWLARAMILTRERKGLEPLDVAYRARITTETVGRWEDGKHWPRDLDTALSTYASLGNLSGPRAVCELALELWRDAERSPTQLVEDAAADAAASTKQAPDAQPETPAAKPSEPEAA